VCSTGQVITSMPSRTPRKSPAHMHRLFDGAAQYRRKPAAPR
jgi:hypothetical protein